MEKRTWTITLADGIALGGLSLNGNNYISSKKITEDVFTDNLDTVTIEARVYNAVTHPTSSPWITPEEYEEITGQPYVVENEEEETPEA